MSMTFFSTVTLVCRVADDNNGDDDDERYESFVKRGSGLVFSSSSREREREGELVKGLTSVLSAGMVGFANE